MPTDVNFRKRALHAVLSLQRHLGPKCSWSHQDLSFGTGPFSDYLFPIQVTLTSYNDSLITSQKKIVMDQLQKRVGPESLRRLKSFANDLSIFADAGS